MCFDIGSNQKVYCKNFKALSDIKNLSLKDLPLS